MTRQKACILAKSLVRTIYGGYFKHTPSDLTSSFKHSRFVRRREVFTVEVREKYISMKPVKVDIWIQKKEVHGEIIHYSTHYDFLEPSFSVPAKMVKNDWQPIKPECEGQERASISRSKAGKAVRRYLKRITGRKNWRTRALKQAVGRYPVFEACTIENEENGTPKIKLVVKDGFEVVIVEFSPMVYPSIIIGVKAEKERNKRRANKPVKRSVATATAKAFISKHLNIDRKRVKGESDSPSKDGKSIVVKVYVDDNICPYTVRVSRDGEGVKAEMVRVSGTIVML